MSARTRDAATRAYPRKAPHRWTSAEAAIAGRKGGQVRPKRRKALRAKGLLRG